MIKKLDVLAESILQKKGKNKIAMVLRFMEDYGKKHFLTEEEFMEKSAYVYIEEHRKQHEKFNNAVIKLKRDLDSEKDMEHFASSVQRFLIDWLILHIKTTDKKMGEFLKGNLK